MKKNIVEQVEYQAPSQKFVQVGYWVPKKGQYYRSLNDKRIYKAESGKDCIINTSIFKKVK